MYEPSTTEMGGSTDLYAHWTNQYTLKFNFGNGTVNSVVLDFNETTAYPDGIMKARYTFDK